MDAASIKTQLLLLKQVKQTAEVKEQIRKLKNAEKYGRDYDWETDWWPNKYPDM